MKRWMLRITLGLILGAVTTVGVAWAFAIWGSFRFDPTNHFSHSTGRQWEVSVSNGLGVTRVSRVPNNGLWSVGGARPSRKTIPYWSVTRDRPPAGVFDDQTMPWHIKLAYGWPFRASYAEVWRAIKLQSGQNNPSNRFSASTGIEILDDGSGQPLPFRTLPVRPILPGFLINTLFYAVIWFGLFLGIGAVRRTIRRKRGRCVKCVYDLRGTPVDVSGPGAGCSECGWGREDGTTNDE